MNNFIHKLIRFMTIIRKDGINKTRKIVFNYVQWNYYKYFHSRSLILKRIQGNKMYLDLQNPGISKVVALHGVREPGHTQLLKEEVKEGMIVIDLGANIGYYTLLAASLVKNKGKVYAFEPDPRNFYLLNKNIKINRYSNIVETYPIAISDTTGKAIFHLSNKTNLNTMLDPDKYPSTFPAIKNKIEIKTMSIDDFMYDKGDVNFIRMDIEGFEVEAFNGMMTTLNKSRPPCKILFEVHPQYYTEDHSIRQPLKKIMDIGFKSKVVVSAGKARPKIFAQLGYKPYKVIRDGEYSRGFYHNLSEKDVLEIACSIPKCTRYILLEKR